MSNPKNVFEGFTNLYSLSKTLRFELKPTGNTQNMLDEAGVFEKDRIKQEKYERTKPFFDMLHREFIDECLKDKKIHDLDKYFNKLKKLQKNKKDDEAKKEFKKVSQELRTEINDYFKKADSFEVLFGEKVFEELKKNMEKKKAHF